MDETFPTVNGYRSFSFGDIIIINDNKFKHKSFRFIKVDGEDYLLYDVKEQDTICIRAYYLNTYIKLKEENVTITTWDLSYVG